MPRRKTDPESRQHHEALAAEVERTTILIPKEARRALTKNGRLPVSTVIRALVDDRLSLYGLPVPAVVVLEREMRSLGLDNQRDYVVWLLMRQVERLTKDEPRRADSGKRVA